ncbi:MAG: AAA family ATPase [Terracidiphilus sp.]
MKLIFIYGMPASGKLTVAQELVAITGYKLFHNHLVVDLLQTVFEFGSPEFVALREEFWLSVFDRASRSPLPGMIFTFNPESTVRPEFISNVKKIVAEAGGELHFIELTAPLPELKRRMGTLSRLQYKKLASVPLFEQLHQEGVFAVDYMPKPELSIDTSIHQPARAALQIARALNLLPVD